MRLRTRSAPLQPLAYSLDEAPEVCGLGTSKIKEAIAAGELAVVEIGKRVLVLEEDLRAYLARHRVTRGNGGTAAPEPPTAEIPLLLPTPPAPSRISPPLPRRRGRPPGPARRRPP
jgi:excisionase family DNA binding protein